ncbi:diphosphoinositol-polyphosphate diphosphatase [Marchantia polymorpha subsp. ruderalis]|uniref:Nudix hydrolase domain-containing protein n=2 Tax=Marchantia polymorpha TaxID=3197 RepID=A0AAF6BFM7_MARPO|nr:hypothetical protein MARPO_0171s0023 [Marchantia polymorpha]BBN10811.1 hypothetical protein Mp_5g06600 [Marchantia polymorpha subsp. ruderalis]|eukprot:PTQ28181.1 hypothetical protein MARPO_0171s0023 [Marchantia polymorpha]
MTALVARTGRHQQRYDQGYRLVAGCIPYRYGSTDDGNGNANPEHNIEVLMITSQRGEGLLFPKGGWETDETVEEAALREALEEAGVRGDLQEKLGEWDFKSKRQQGDCCPEGLCKAHMFALAVNEQLESWPEQHARQRQWFSLADAVGQCRVEWMRDALEKCKVYLCLPTANEENSPPSPHFANHLPNQGESLA